MNDTVFKSIQNMTYNPPFWLPGGHLQTIFPAVARTIENVTYQRERIDTRDGDFLDLDWSKSVRSPSRRLVVLCHGLEGSSHRAYMRGMARAVNDSGFDALAWNYRACSGAPNLKLRFYHNGATDDLAWVVKHAVATNRYDALALVGFSLGGNLVLNYLAWHKLELPTELSKAVVFSVPLHIASSAKALSRPANVIYMKRFLKDLKGKVRVKEKQFPGEIDSIGYDKIKDFKGFDDRYTAPLHGFVDAEDYWRRCSGVSAIPDISHPTVIVNAQNDPFLTPACYPKALIKSNDNVCLLTPAQGGHCGFPSHDTQGHYWSERLVISFLE